MDKAEYKIKLEQINAYAEAGNFQGASETADTIDWRRVKSVRTLCMISEIYEANKRYADGLEILRYAYRRSPQSKTVLYRLVELSLRVGNINDAKKYYDEFEQASPHDTSRYVLKYKLLRAEKAPLEEQIAVLKEYKEREYTERWAYELARLYKKSGQKQRCIEECDDMILWFAEGRYVTRAMELKMQLTPLTESQKARYESRLAAAKEAEEKEALLFEETKTAADVAALEEESSEEITESGEPSDETEEVSGTVSTAEMIEKMNAAADASLQGARKTGRMPNVKPAVRQSISGRNAGGNEMQDQLASSIRAVFSGIRTQQENTWDEPDQRAAQKELLEADAEPVPESEEADADLAELFAETENTIAQTVQEATSDGGETLIEESTEAAGVPWNSQADQSREIGEQSEASANEAETKSDELSEDELSEDDLDVSFVERDGVIEIAASGKTNRAEEDPAADMGYKTPKVTRTDSLTGRETDESLGLTREFNFRKEFARVLDEDESGARRYTAADERRVQTKIPDPEEAAARIVAEAGMGQETPRDGRESKERSAHYENVPELSERLLADMTEVPAGDYMSSVEILTDGFSDSRKPEGQAQSADVPETEQTEKKSSIIDHLLDEPDMIDRMDVVPRSFDETERKLFSYFSAIPGIGEQVSIAIADIHNNSGDRTSKSGNVIIVGRRGSGKTKLADSLILAVCKDLNITAAKTAKIIARDFNQKDAAAIVKKMAGGFLIIEGAGELAEDTVDKLNRAMEFRTDDMVVILEDEKQDMKDLLERYPAFAAKFTSKIAIPVFTNDELVTFGKTYAQEQGYSFDEMATLALYTMIGENQKNAEPVTISMVREMVDKAIAKSKSKRFPIFGKTQVGADGRIILREKDFAF